MIMRLLHLSDWENLSATDFSQVNVANWLTQIVLLFQADNFIRLVWGLHVDQTAFVLVGVSRNSFFKYDDIQ